MKVLVTGAGGFVGRRLVTRLLGDGHEVIGHGPGPPPSGSRLPWVTVDLADPAASWSGALERVDSVIHLAALAHRPAKGARRLLGQVNHIATTRLYKCCCSTGVGRFVYLSSIKATVERTAPGTPISETAIPHPEDPYGQAKRAAEQGIEAHAGADARRTGYVIIRPPLVHGPGVRANFRSLLRLCDTPFPMPLGGLTRNRRSFIALDNLVDALTLALISSRVRNRTYHVADDPPWSTAALIGAIRRRLGRPERLFAIPDLAFRAAGAAPPLASEIARLTESLAVDSGRFRAEAGWVPPLLPGEGLDRTVAAYVAGWPTRRRLF